MKTLLKHLIKFLAAATIRKYSPGVIGITGSVGKTSTKDAIYAVLRSARRVRATPGNYNNEFGVALTVLGDWNESGGFFFWTKVMLVACLRLLFRVNYPEVLIIEYAADRPGDIKYLLDIVRPQISVVSAIGEIPVHLEFYSSPEAVAREKSKLIECLPATGFALLNTDDAVINGIRERTRAHLITYGFESEADLRIANFETRIENQLPVGISFKLQYAGSFVPVRLDGCFGRGAAYAAAAAAGVGIVFGLHLVQISDALLSYRSPEHRMRLLSGIKGTRIIDDAYNASPLSVLEAIRTVKELPAKRRVAILGDMLELGKYSLEAHEAVGRAAAKAFDFLITVGPRAKFIAESAAATRYPAKSVLTFDTAREAAKIAPAHLRRGDLVLIKASRGIHLEEVVEALSESR